MAHLVQIKNKTIIMKEDIEKKQAKSVESLMGHGGWVGAANYAEALSDQIGRASCRERV